MASINERQNPSRSETNRVASVVGESMREIAEAEKERRGIKDEAGS